MLFHILSLFLLPLGCLAAPTDSSLPDHVIQKRATCTPASLGNSALDDTPAIHAAIASCGNGGTIVIPAGKTYSLRTMLSFASCVNCDFRLEGTLKASDNTTYWATQTAIIYFNKISGVKFRSLNGTGLIDGNGQTSYDLFATDSSLVRPTALLVNGGSSISVSGITMKNVPNVFISQKGGTTNANYASITMTAASKSTNAPKNTDGYDIGASTNTIITNAHVTNQDDCVAFKAGADYVTVNTITCSGSHGLSVGSLAKSSADTVKNIYVTKATMINSSKAVGIKLYEGGSAHGPATVSNVTWDGVTVQNCDYAAQIQTCYGSTSTADCAANPSKASLTGIYFKNFAGTTSTKYSPVISSLDCPPSGTCDLYFTNWAVKSPSGTSKNECANIDNSPGITCSSGASG